jgi:hypothetical protein
LWSWTTSSLLTRERAFDSSLKSGAASCCTYPTLLFSGLKPHRARLLEDEGHPQKGILRKAEARSREALALIEAMGRALEAITPRDAKGFFEYCGYRLPVQSF